MVQVDVFWSYGIGAGFAAAAAHHLRAPAAPATGDRPVFATWPAHPGLGEALSRVGDWLTSPVALTLYGMGVVLIPAMIAPMLAWSRAGARAPGAPVLVGGVLVAILGVALGTAIAVSVIDHLLGWWLGVPVAVA